MFNKKILYIFLALAVAFSFSACGKKDDTAKKDTKENTKKEKPAKDDKKTDDKKSSGEINLYTTRHYESDDALYEKFTKETGIKVNVVNEKKAGALIEKIKSQGENVQADLFITADAGNLAKAKTAGILQKVDSKVLDTNIPKKYRDAESFWFGLTKRARIMLYSKERVSKDDLKNLDYTTLANDKKWDKKILVRSSSSIYNQSLVASFVEILGEEKAAEWVKNIADKMARKPEGNDRDQALAIKNKKGDIAISNSYYYGKLVNDKKKDSKYFGVADVVGIYFPNQDKNGVHVNISGIALIKNAKNKENAVKFMEFLSEVPQQEQFSAANYEFPVNPKAKMSDLLKSWLDNQNIKELKEQNINLSKLGEHNAKALEIMTKAKWDKK